ncbi:MAG: uncharacterized protein JWM68_3828 [Verrucomicrobiales bacterium]|nr:uncharacterized protein [Verrucomicrobiales bacterium]
METDLPQKIRTFVGIFPPLAVAEKLKEVENVLQKDLLNGAVGWTRVEQIHLTLNFLGNIPSARLLEFETVLAEVRVPAFSLRCQGLGCFPNSRKPTVLWAGLTGELEPLRQLKSLLDKALEKLGIVPEERPFHPHLTLGRVKQLHSKERQNIAALLKESESQLFGEWCAERIDFMRSTLSSAGSNYSVLKSFPLH